eukprot:7639878-Pyramimonas_sp.AAC.1
MTAKKRFGQINRFRKSTTLAREAKGLWSTGALHQASYGHRAFGLAPSELPRLRRQAGHMAAGCHGGKCLTTAPSIEMWDMGPGLEIRKRV